MNVEKFSYDNQIVKQFSIATVIWGVVGMLVGLIIAFQLVFPELNFKLSFAFYEALQCVLR